MNVDRERALFDHIWVVSLPAATDRRQHIAEHLPAAGFEHFSFFDATSADDPQVALVDNEVFKYPPCFRCGKLDCGNPDCNNFLTAAQIAVFLTYKRLWQTIAGGTAERVLIVEDDVCFHPQTQRVLSWLHAEIDAGRIPFRAAETCLLRLGWARTAEHDAENVSPWIDTAIKWSNPCHAITRGYARVLLERYTGIIHTADVYQHQIVPKPGEAFTIHPPIASELSWTEGRFDSLIHPKASRVDYLRKQGQDSAAAEAANKIATAVKKKHFRPLLVTGHPRCGTGYAASLCKQLGVDIGHEKLGQQGISSWMFAVDGEINPYALDEVSRTRRAFAWKYMIAPVRDLATAAGSVMRDSEHAPPSYNFRREHIRSKLGIDLDAFATPFERAIRSVVAWMRIILLQQPDLVFRIEDQHELVRQFLIESGLASSEAVSTVIDTSAVNADKPYRGIRYPRGTTTQEDWDALSTETKQEVTWYCETFGYASPLSAIQLAGETSESWADPAATSGLNTLFLEPSGWVRSRVERAPQRKDGSPLPWFTYSAIEFLHQIVRPSDRVFEYGAGHSTLWWQEHVAAVVSVEHDLQWIDQIKSRLRPNAHLEAKPIDAPYASAHMQQAADFFRRERRTTWTYDAEKIVRRGLNDERFIGYATFIMEADTAGAGFDIIVVDGMARRLCTWMALRHLKPNGIVIIDNSNRSDYDLAYKLLAEAGFRQIPFWGLVPGADFMTSTSFFVRSLDRLPSGDFSGNSFGLPEY